VVFLADHPRPTRWQGSGGGPPPQVLRTAGQPRGLRSHRDGGSRIGTRYRHTTPEMATRVVAAIEGRLTIVLKVAEEQLARGSGAAVAQ
jgi:hypothetical protein